MKFFAPAALLLLTAQLAYADDFTARATAGRAASSTPAGSKFDQSLIPILGKVGDICDPPGTKLPDSELGTFDLVGDITPDGVLINVEVKPATKTSLCFATQLAKNHFDPPPRPSGNYPIVVQLTVTNQ
jgi:hypothetical protein